MKIIAIAMSRIPAPNANGIQVMKVCQALSQLGHELTLFVPDMEPWGGTRDELKNFYGLDQTFDVRWLSSPSRRIFTWQAVREARKNKPDLIYTWSPQSSVFALLHRLPIIHEVHEPPLGRFGPLWYRFFLRIFGKKRLVPITNALKDVLAQKYGLPTETTIALYELGFSDRVISQDLAASLNLAATQKKDLVKALKQDRDGTHAVIEKYPRYFQERMDELLQ